MATLLFYYAAMIAGYYLASRLRDIKGRFKNLDKIFNGLIVFLILIMGIRMGSDEKVIANLGMIGAYSLIMTVVIVFFSVFFVYIVRKNIKLDKEANNIKKKDIMDELDEMYTDKAVDASKKTTKLSKVTDTLKSADLFRPVPDTVAIDGGKYEEDTSPSKNNLQITILVVVPLTLGLLLGYKVILPCDMDAGLIADLTGNLLIIGVTLLLFAIGFSLGLGGNVLSSVKKIGIKFLIFPLAAILGSIVGGALCGFILPITIPEGMAIGSGFGWYTMAPTVITEAGHTYAGAISFMHNVIREMGGIVMIPFFASKIGFIEATAVPGVCAMDIGMPIIERCTKEELVAYSFGMGVSMSIVVPLLVPLFINI